MTSNNLSILGIANKAGKITLGTAACEKGLKSRKIKLLIVHESLSDRSKKHFSCLCEKYGVDIMITEESLGKALGKDYILVAGVTDKGFKKVITQA